MILVYRGVVSETWWTKKARDVELQPWADPEVARRELWSAVHEVAFAEDGHPHHVSGALYIGYRIMTDKGPKFELASNRPVWNLFYRAGRYYWVSQTPKTSAV